MAGSHLRACHQRLPVKNNAAHVTAAITPIAQMMGLMMGLKGRVTCVATSSISMIDPMKIAPATTCHHALEKPPTRQMKVLKKALMKEIAYQK
jgi:hypothetical protein